MAGVMSPEQFAQFMAAIMGQLQGLQQQFQQQQLAAATPVGRPARRGLLNSKGFGRLEKFTGGEERWKDWAFDFKVAVKAQSERVEKVMRKVERAGEYSLQELMEQDVDGMENGDYQGIEDTAGELFQQLIMITDGEAKMLVKSVDDGD
eukprot:11069949-Lingulodinium_polyedra.AAC.1